MTDVVLDSNALTAWADKGRNLLALLEVVQRTGGVAFVPSVCLVESLTGTALDAELNRLIKGTRIINLDEPIARTAARLRVKIDHHDAVDPVVVATAIFTDAQVLSADPHVVKLAAHAEAPVAVLDPRD